MGLFSKPKEEKLPLFAVRGRNEKTGKKETYLLRYECDDCHGLFRSQSDLTGHKCKGR
jgi:hypothetical protein